MPHFHYCKICKLPVANCSDESCTAEAKEGQEAHANAGEHYCSVHQPKDSPHYVAPTPPLKRG